MLFGEVVNLQSSLQKACKLIAQGPGQMYRFDEENGAQVVFSWFTDQVFAISRI